MRFLVLFACCLSAFSFPTISGAAESGPNDASSVDGFLADSLDTQKLERSWGRGKLVVVARPAGLTINGDYMQLSDILPADSGTQPVQPMQALQAIPTDLYSELSASYSRATSHGDSWSVSAALPGAPTLGPTGHVDRFAGMQGEELPLSQAWVNPGDLSFGAVSTGYQKNRLRLDASAFNARQDGEQSIQQLSALDSRAARLSFNPSAHWALQASRGWLNTPGLEYNSLQRSTASALYQRKSGDRRFETMLAWGRKDQSLVRATDAYLLDTSFELRDTHALFGRIEHVSGGETVDAAASPGFMSAGTNRFSVGYEYTRALWDRFSLGIGVMQNKAFASDAPSEFAGDSRVAFLRLGTR